MAFPKTNTLKTFLLSNRSPKHNQCCNPKWIAKLLTSSPGPFVILGRRIRPFDKWPWGRGCESTIVISNALQLGICLNTLASKSTYISLECLRFDWLSRDPKIHGLWENCRDWLLKRIISYRYTYRKGP